MTKDRREYYLKNRDKILAKAKEYRDFGGGKERNKEWYEKLRPFVIDGYGGKCSCCGEENIEFLCLDHVNGGGKKHLQEKGFAAHYRDAKRRNFPSDYRVLCFNCNFSLGHHGYCPHNKDFK